VEFNYLKASHLSNQSHDPVIVRLQVRLLDHVYPEHRYVVAEPVDEVVEELEVESFPKVIKHLFETELVEKHFPGVILGVVVFSILPHHRLLFEALLVVGIVHPFEFVLVLRLSYSLFDAAVVRLQANLCRAGLLPVRGDNLVDPVELLAACCFPLTVIFVRKHFLFLIKVKEWAWLGKQELFRLLVKINKLVHMLAASMVLLILRVCDSLLQTGRNSLIIRHILSQSRVVLVEVVYFLQALQLSEQLILNLSRKTSIVVV